MSSGSKYETMAKAIEKKIEELDKGADENIRQKQLENDLANIDKETEKRIKEINLTPIDGDQITAEAESTMNNKLLILERDCMKQVDTIKTHLNNLEINYAAKKKELEENLKITKEDISIKKNADIILITQEYERALLSVNNTKEILELKIQEARDNAEKQKERIKIDLANVKAVTESKAEKMKCLDTLYNDIKEISLKLGDVKK